MRSLDPHKVKSAIGMANTTPPWKGHENPSYNPGPDITPELANLRKIRESSAKSEQVKP